MDERVLTIAIRQGDAESLIRTLQGVTEAMRAAAASAHEPDATAANRR